MQNSFKLLDRNFGRAFLRLALGLVIWMAMSSRGWNEPCFIHRRFVN